jgi:CRISPR/Cas system-associated protein Cas10 (large subunit of type III CRISPR-Cas system)
MNLARIFAEQLCPACGYKLDFQPWSGRDSERHCPSCGIHFGIDDKDEAEREAVYLNWRNRWLSTERRWWSKEPEPADYDPTSQMARLKQLAD